MSINSTLNRWKSLYEEVMTNEQYSDSTRFGLKPLLMDARNRIYISENIDKEMSIYIEFDEKEVINTYTPPLLKGISISIKDNIVQKNYYYLKITRENECPEELFISLSISLADEIEQSTSDLKTLLVIDGVLSRYSHLFTKKYKSLSREVEQGLYCELLFLEELLNRDGDTAIKFWTGPEKNKHDFVLDEKHAVEIKSTNNQEQLIIHISNENQLDNVGLDELKLVTYVIEINNSGETIDKVVSRILSKISSADMYLQFLTDLALVEIDPSVFKGKYNFTVSKKCHFLVDDAFPKITKSNITSKAYDVKYRLNLSDEQPLLEE